MHMQSAKRFLQSSELGLPHPLTRRRVCPPSPFQSRWMGLRERGWGSPNSDVGTYTVVLYLYRYNTVGGRLTSVKDGLASTLLALTKLSLIPDSEARFRAISWL
jgi:hypothetical protein